MRNFLIAFVVILAATIKLNVADMDCKWMPDCKGKNNMTYTHHLPHETDRHKYYKCLGVYGCEMDCGNYNNEKMVFYPSEQWCDCEVRPCEKEASTVEPPPGTCEEGKKYQHADPTKFYWCYKGKLIEGKCLENHCFNPRVRECDLTCPKS